MNADNDFRGLFVEAVAGNTGAASGFADRLAECWPDLLARWQDDTRQAWQNYYLDLWEWEKWPQDTKPPGEPYTNLLLRLDVPGPLKNSRFTYLVMAPQVRTLETGESETRVHFYSEFHVAKSGVRASRNLYLPSPPQWDASHYAAVASSLIELALASRGDE